MSRRWIAVIAILVLAANLRAAISAVGPVLPQLAGDLRLSPAAQGALTAAPVAAFALVSPFGHRVARRLGLDAAVALALVLLAVGTAVRSVPVGGHAVPLALGTLLLGGGIAIANVLLPVLVRRDFPRSIPTITGHYIAVQSAVAALAAAIAVPLAEHGGGWRVSLGVWALPVIVALIVWMPRTGRQRPAPVRGPPVPPGTAVWRSPVAWQLAAYFGVQSCIFYVLLGWLPTIEQELGVAAAAAGVHLGIFLVVGIAANIAVPSLLSVGGDQRFATVAVAALLFLAVAGLRVWPAAAVVWVSLAGFAAGASMVVSLSLIALRSASGRDPGPLSSMVQGAGYAGVTGGLVAVGVLKELGSSGPVVAAVLALAVVQALLGTAVGRDRRS